MDGLFIPSVHLKLACGRFLYYGLQFTYFPFYSYV